MMRTQLGGGVREIVQRGVNIYKSDLWGEVLGLYTKEIGQSKKKGAKSEIIEHVAKWITLNEKERG